MRPVSNQTSILSASVNCNDESYITNNVPAVPALTRVQLRAQRRTVKDLSRSVEADYREYKTLSRPELQKRGIYEFTNRFGEARKQLDVLLASPLSDALPAESALRSVRSGALLTAASITRAGAVIAGGLGGVTESIGRVALEVGVIAVMTPFCGVAGPVVGACQGANTVGEGVWKYLKNAVSANTMEAEIVTTEVVVGTIAGVVVGAVGGAVFGTLITALPVIDALPKLLLIPRHAASRGSLGCKMFRAIDYFDRARAHTKRKNLSAAEIAEKIRLRLDMEAANIESQMRKPTREEPTSLTAMLDDDCTPFERNYLFNIFKDFITSEKAASYSANPS